MKNIYIKLTALFLIQSFLMCFQANAQRTVGINNKTLKGWYAYAPISGKHDNAAGLFQTENGLIRLHGRNAGYLISEQSYRNFRLKVQFRWNMDSIHFEKKSTVKNSGVMYLVPDTASDILWPAGIQFQIKKGFSGDFIFLNGVTAEIDGKKTIPGKSIVYNRIAENEKEVGKWNRIEILVKNGIITQKLNGKIVNRAKNPSVLSGRILLQYEGYPVDFRKIKIKKL
ncbi:MAG: 3-keto-disaccharide hydrolase [Paludibacteraceae bacterium]